MENEDKAKLVPELRKQSRRDYLWKRGQEMLEDLELDIQEEEYYFGDMRCDNLLKWKMVGVLYIGKRIGKKET